MRRSNLLLSVIVILSCQFTSCGYVEEKSVTYQSFPSELWSSLETFEKEASIRGLTIDLNSMDVYGVIEEIEQQHVAGSCQYSSNQPNKITIDKEFWDQASSLGKEFVMFHELGHCILSRGHRESADANGQCISIMQSGLGSCILAYGSATRSKYLDELFLPSEF